MEALLQIVQSGRAIYAGISNYNAEQTQAAVKIARKIHLPLIVNQRRYYIFDRKIEREGLKETAKKCGLGIIAFSPLAQELLTDRYINGIPADSRIAHDGHYLHREDLTEKKLSAIKQLNEIAAARGQSLADIALSWILRDGSVCSVLVGASRPEQIKDSVRCISNTDFTDDEIAEIDEISRI